MSSQVKTTIMAAHAEGSHVNTTTTTTKNFKATKATETTTWKFTSSTSSQTSNSKFLSPSSSPTTQHIRKSLPTFQSSRFQSTATTTITKTTTIPTAGATEDHFKDLGVVACNYQILYMGLFGFVHWLLMKRRHRRRLKRPYIQRKEAPKKYQQDEQQDEQQGRQQEQRPDAIVNLRRYNPYEGTRQKCWLALVRWDPHLFPPTHGYYILKDRQGLQRFVKAENLLPSNKRRHYPRKLRFSSNVAMKFIARKDDPINADAWNTEYHRMVQRNSYWQQQQWRLEAIGKRKHHRLVVSAIAMRDFRRVVLSNLIDHAQMMQRRWAFRKTIIPRLADHSHGLRWKWALKRHHSKAPFQQFILSALPRHRHRLRLKWQTKEFFRRQVAPTLVDHSITLRLKWALLQAQQQDEEMENQYDDNEDDDDDEDHPLQLKWALQHQHARLNFHEAILGSLKSHCQSLKLRWGFRKLFRQTVVPALADHLLRMRLEWALRHAELQDREMEHDDYGFYDDDDDDDDDDDRNDDDDNFDDDDNITVATAPPPTIRPPRQRPSGILPSTTTNGATVWVNGLRRSKRHQPMLGSIFENGRRRSARFL